MTDRSRWPVKKKRMGEDPEDDDGFVEGLSGDECMNMVWTITEQMYGFRGEPIGEQRLRRDVGRVIRGGR